MFENDDINAIYHYTSSEDLRYVRYYGPHPSEPISIVVVKNSSMSSPAPYLCNDPSQFIRRMKREACLFRRRHYIDVEIREFQMDKNKGSDFRPKLLSNAIVYIESEERDLRDNLPFIIDNMHPKSMLCICCVKSGRSSKSPVAILRGLLLKVGNFGAFERGKVKSDWHLFFIRRRANRYVNINKIFHRIFIIRLEMEIPPDIIDLNPEFYDKVNDLIMDKE
ncbi:unnamed protein product [Rodentolepis nana]|uniref:Nuclear shuttle protein n=1 Tax=Rodentolepis nana TaxID=102285 RepID=A0A0R3TG64_RODNA|nr:unnamed protein product [Rodentolepis nana]